VPRSGAAGLISRLGSVCVAAADQVSTLHDIPLTSRHRQIVQASHTSYSAGFTLFEMLVVLMLMALTATASTLAMGNKPGHQPLLPVVARVAADLRAARNDAMQRSRIIEVRFDGQARSYIIDGAAAARQLPGNIVFAFSTMNDGLRADYANRLLFFPDGSSTGGQLSLSSGPSVVGQRAVVLSVDWLTGAVREVSSAP
jgi:general secretion pathway protein H